MRAIKLLLITASALLAGAGALAAQTPPAPPTSPGGTPGAKGPPAPDPKLSLATDVFSYESEGRKDPFAPLVGTDEIGPLFEDLRLGTHRTHPTGA